MDKEPVNPWLGEIILDYRRKFSDEELRKGYRDYVKGGSSDYSWENYVGRSALKAYTREHPEFLTPRCDFQISDHARDVLNNNQVNCLADLMQITKGELVELVYDSKERLQITRYLNNSGLRLRTCKAFTYKLSIESVDNECNRYDRALEGMISRIKDTCKDYLKNTMTLDQFKELIDMFEQADSFGQMHDCGVEVREDLFHEYAFLMELRSPFFKGYYDQAVRVSERMMYYLSIMESEYMKRAGGYVIFGNIYSMMSDNAKALEKYLAARDTLLAAPESEEKDKELRQINSRLGSCYWSRKEYEKAIESYKKSLEYSKKILFMQETDNDPIYKSISEIYAEMGDKENADYYRGLIKGDDFDDDFDDLF